MAIILPMAQTQIGGVRLPRPSGPTVADALVPLAQGAIQGLDALQQQAQRDQAEANLLTLRRARVDAVTALGQARADAEADPDYDGLPDRFQARVQDARTQLAASLPPELQDEFGVGFDELAASHFAGVAQRAVTLRRDTGRVQLGSQTQALIGQAAAAPDATTRAATLDVLTEELDLARQSGLIDAAEYQAQLTKAHESVSTAEALRALRENPAAVIEGMKAGAFTGITDPGQR